MKTGGSFACRSRALAAALGAMASACGGDTLDGFPTPDAGDASYVAPPFVSDAGDAEAAPDAAAPVVKACSGPGLSICTVGRCTLSGDAASLPAGSIVTLTDEPLDPALTTDALLPFLCKVDLPAGVDAGAAAFTLQMAVPAGATLPASGAVLFSWSPPNARELASASAGGNDASSIAGIVTASGTYGATRVPAPPSLTAILGTDPRSSADLPSLVRNVTGGTMNAAFYDGSHLYLGSGGRVLVYDGIPADPSVKPKVVLGQPDLNSSLVGITSALFEADVTSIWSNGQKLVVGTGARTLVWSKIPTASYTPADLVLGQPDFSSDVGNNGGISAASSNGTTGIDSDGTRLAITDWANSRVLVWSTFPTKLNQPATSVIGQPNFSTRGVDVGQLPIYLAEDVAFDHAGTGAFVASGYDGPEHTANPTTNDPALDYQAAIWSNAVQPTKICVTLTVTFSASGALGASDACGRRIGIWKTAPTAVTPMDFPLGQPDLHVANVHPTSASALSPGSARPGARAANGKFLVHDTARVLLWDPEPSYAFEPAARVFGQPGFTTDDVGIDYRNISAATLGYPADVAVKGSVIAVADRGNNRVVLYNGTNAGNGAPASVVLGQPDFQSFIPDFDQVSPNGARLSGPAGVALDGTHLIVADTENHRVLIWNQVPTASATPADLVLGQADFTSKRPNHGRGDADHDGQSDADADGFFAPTGVASDGTHLFVADRVNHRVLVWHTFPTANGQSADAVIGQMNMTALGSNAGSGFSTVVPLGFQLPSGLALDGSTLYVADTENNRVVRIANATTAPTATAWIGQPDGVSVSNPNFRGQAEASAGYPNFPVPSSASVMRPRGVVVAGGHVYISEADANRVHLFDQTTLAYQSLLGQSDPTSAVPNAGGIGGSTVATPAGLAADANHLYIADSGNHRVLASALAGGVGSAASFALGQPTLVNAEFNGGVVPSAGGSARPRGLFVDQGDLFSTEADHNRVVVSTAPSAVGAGGTVSGIKRLFGQPNDALFLPNSGGPVSASTLASPRGVFADGAHVAVADTANNRVVIYDRGSASLAATLVLGQMNFVSSAANRDAAASASTLTGPEGVYSDGVRFYVADTGNHRVLVWDAWPTESGQPADHELGQADFEGALPNRGGAVDGGTLSSPTSVHVANGQIYIADAGNNRVLDFVLATALSTDGSAADAVLGQPNLTSRTPGAKQMDPTLLAGPVQLADDGAYLYICDRDLGRVVSYPLIGGATPALAFLPSVATFAGPDGLAAEKTPLFTSRLYVADTNTSRVVVIDGVSRLAAL